jgi:hypothetical protein
MGSPHARGRRSRRIDNGIGLSGVLACAHARGRRSRKIDNGIGLSGVPACARSRFRQWRGTTGLLLSVTHGAAVLPLPYHRLAHALSPSSSRMRGPHFFEQPPACFRDGSLSVSGTLYQSSSASATVLAPAAATISGCLHACAINRLAARSPERSAPSM